MGGIAGSVAPVFRDEGYVATEKYDFYHALIHNNKLYFCRQDGTVGHEPQAASDEYWFLSLDGTFADAASLGGETAAQWQSKLDNIQTMSQAVLSTTGWYRVAEYAGGSSNKILKGGLANSVTLFIKRNYQNTDNEQHWLLFESISSNQSFTTMSSKSNVQFISKARYTCNTTEGKAYLEIYYDGNTANMCHFEITHGDDDSKYWQAITPTLTEETVDGVTVTCEYDIPANASPATNVDIDKAVAGIATVDNALKLGDKAESELSVANSAKLGGVDANKYALVSSLAQINLGRLDILESSLDTLAKDRNIPSHLTYIATIVPVTTSDGYLFGGGSWTLIGMEYGRYGHQLGFQGSGIKLRTLQKEVWSDWDDISTTANLAAALAGYLPLDGGGIVKDGDVHVRSESASQRVLRASNSLRNGFFGVSLNGILGIYDGTNEKWLIASTVDGVNTFNGTASGNLPLDCGKNTKTVSSNAHAPIKIKCTNEGSSFSGIEYQIGDNSLGSLGFDYNAKPTYRDEANAQNYNLLHSGNYANYTVYKGTSAPSSTTCIWVDTANNVIKAYKDGAWTQVS